MNSYAEENYLKVIYKLSLMGKKRIFTKSIADKIDTKPSSVTDMIKKLALKQLLNYEKYHGVTLTGRGESIAVGIIRKHRLWEEFLSQYLGFKWDEVHDLAEELEHIDSDALIEKLDRFLNYPKFDPHGDPIPDREGVFPAPESIRLSEMKTGETGVVAGLVARTPSFLTYLGELNIQIGSELQVKNKVSFDQSVKVLVGNNLYHISQKASENILMRKK